MNKTVLPTPAGPMKHDELLTLTTLALVRKLAVPVQQVNIVRKQVNVAGPWGHPQ